MTIAQRRNGAALALPDFAALMGDTQTSEPSADQALNEATKILFRARMAYAALDSEDTVEPQALATAWLNLWRAQAQHTQLVAQFEWPSAEFGKEKAIGRVGA